jgi:glycosidase
VWPDYATRKDWEKSAKMLAVCLHFQQGTPYIYQGEELGMTNFPWTDLSQCNDVEIFNAWKELVEEKKALSEAAMLAGIKARCRDNARTPMQWDSSPHAGFTKGTPWLEVNPNYQDSNAEKQRDDPDSIFHFYKKIIALRRQCPVIIEGRYEQLLPEDEHIYAYRRIIDNRLVRQPGSLSNKPTESLLVVCNFSGEDTPLDESLLSGGSILIANYSGDTPRGTLRPWEARVYRFCENG